MSMSTSLLRRLVLRPTSITPLTRVAIASFATRTHLNAENQSATTGQASPGTAGNVAQPQSDSAGEQSIKKSRGKEGSSRQDTASTAEPVSVGSDGETVSGAHVGEERTEADEQIMQDPGKPAEEKAKQVDEQGQKPLDAANK